MRIESSGHSRGNPRLYELVEHAPKTAKSPTVWAWPKHREVGAVGRRKAPGPGRGVNQTPEGSQAMTQALDEIKIGGMGVSRKRVEDNRFIRGKGNYTDDIHLPGMLHMEILRSPLAHARITKIDASRAWDIPGVHLVLTGDMMATRNLAWMPTLSYDTQTVLATDKVRFQGQEVACVIADDPYIAKDACEAIEIDYEPLPVVVNPRQAAAADAPVIRDDKETRMATSSTTGRSATPRAPTRPSSRRT